MSSTEIETLLEAVQAAFDRPPTDVEDGLDVDDAAMLQLRKACRLLAGGRELLDAGYHTLVVEASFTAIERTLEFRLLERGEMDPRGLPGSHTTVYREAARIGIVSEGTADGLADLWREHRARTYYRDGLATSGRAERVYDLATEVHAFVAGRSASGHECVCE